MWLWRTIGGLLMLGSHVVFAANVWAMRPQPTRGPATYSGPGRESGVTFGTLHTDHRAIVSAAIIVFFVLTLVMAVLPGLRGTGYPGPPAGATPRGSEAETRPTSVHARGLRVLSHPVRA